MNGVLTLADALRLSPARRMAYVVVVGELKGAEFDWGAMQFRDANA